MTVSLGLKETFAKMFDAVPARKRQFLTCQQTNDHHRHHGIKPSKAQMRKMGLPRLVGWLLGGWVGGRIGVVDVHITTGHDLEQKFTTEKSKTAANCDQTANRTLRPYVDSPLRY